MKRLWDDKEIIAIIRQVVEEMVDLSNYPEKSEDETITGTWTFNNGIDFGDGAKLVKDNSNRLDLQYNNDTRLKIGNANLSVKARIDPDSNNNYDLGRNTLNWKDGYFAGQVYAQNTLNVIKVSEMPDSTHFTQTQLDLITNGKQTIVIGDLLGLYNPLISSLQNVSGNYYGLAIGWSATSGTYEASFVPLSILTSQLRVQIDTNPRINTYLKNVNGKQLPAYPSNTGTFVLKCVDGVLTWVAE